MHVFIGIPWNYNTFRIFYYFEEWRRWSKAVPKTKSIWKNTEYYNI